MFDWRTAPYEELIKRSSVKLEVLPNNDEVSLKMALDMIEEIQRGNAIGKNTAFIVPVGPTDQYVKFSKMVNALKISLKNVYFFNMDEYVDDNFNHISKDDHESFRASMDKYVYNVIDKDLIMPEDHRWFPTLGREEEMWKKINEVGGIDICFGGIGINGHIAFNEAVRHDDPITKEEYAKLPTRLLRLQDETKAINSGWTVYSEMPRIPRYAMTIGMREILSARKLKISVGDKTRAYQMRRAMFGGASPQFPVSYMQEHKDATLYVLPETLTPLLPLHGYYSKDGSANHLPVREYDEKVSKANNK